METWAIVALVLGSNIIIALSTFFATKMQVSHSDKRFEREFEKEIVTYQRERRREVRSEPLLKLRTELASMACKYENLVDTARRLRTRSDITDEEAVKLAEEAVNEGTTYKANGNLQQILNIQYDTELITLVNNIRNDYLLLCEYARDYKSLRKELLREFREISLEIETSIPKIQELINKRLEEL